MVKKVHMKRGGRGVSSRGFPVAKTAIKRVVGHEEVKRGLDEETYGSRKRVRVHEGSV